MVHRDWKQILHLWSLTCCEYIVSISMGKLSFNWSMNNLNLTLYNTFIDNNWKCVFLSKMVDCLEWHFVFITLCISYPWSYVLHQYLSMIYLCIILFLESHDVLIATVIINTIIIEVSSCQQYINCHISNPSCCWTTLVFSMLGIRKYEYSTTA